MGQTWEACHPQNPAVTVTLRKQSFFVSEMAKLFNWYERKLSTQHNFKQLHVAKATSGLETVLQWVSSRQVQ